MTPKTEIDQLNFNIFYGRSKKSEDEDKQPNKKS